MQSPTLAIKEMERCKKIGLVGIQIGSNVNQLNLSEPQFLPFFQACEQNQMSVFIHPWEMMGEEKMQKYWLPWLVGMPAETTRAICSLIFGGIFEKCPSLRIAFAHGGGSFPATLGRIEHGFNCRPDLVAIDNSINPRNYLGKFWIDSLVHDPLILDLVMKLFGPERIALGSDYPFPLGELEPGRLIKSMGYEAGTQEMLLHGSALAWLNLEKNAFL
jgi:aminocarboxymuconate-semialdehyde decarboxylase